MTDEGPLPSPPLAGDESLASDATGEPPPYARWSRRAVAFLVDGLIVTVVASAIAAATKHHQPLNSLHFHYVHGQRKLAPIGSALDFFNAVEVLLGFAMAVGFLASTWRATPGMRLLGVYLAKVADDGRVGPGRVLQRSVIFTGATILATHLPYGGLVLCVLLLWPLWDPRRQTIHDKLAQTVVLHGPVPR